MTFNYRFSIIPAGAITDRSLEPRDLQVLCLLGRHTNKLGWCFRSQVKMAEELACGRSSVQRSLDRLYDARWVEKKLRATGEAEADPKHPHTAHAYRVVLDRDDMPEVHVDEEIAEAAAPQADRCPPVGTPAEASDGHRGARPSVGTGCPSMSGHPIKELPEDTPVEPVERETARAREVERLSVKAFLKRWPSAAVDSRAAIEREWEALPTDALQAAIDGIQPFLDELKLHKRSHVPSGATYLHERKWSDLPTRDKPKETEILTFRVWSREWWAKVLAMADRGESIAFAVHHACEAVGLRETSERASRMPSPEIIAALKGVPANGDWVAAWRPWFERRGAKLPHWRERIWVYLPSPEPPPEGCPTLRRSTGPPTQTESLMTNQDYADMSEGRR